ncbi:hypothetical protein BCV70DRAFT_196678 [Testicularia cyperi]|uniref:Cytochrome b561 domain-containing protein n=1 Tax=Testicularia cyperi TaxID=1882483 RepID=A0A317XYL4_9BASI|nr:hypothetical protein BCV70DRAFT_196678 [Testicularia cyperi]
MLSSHDALAAAHAACACIAVLFTIPLALLAARFKANSTPNGKSSSSWFRWHVVLNTLSVLLIILAFGLGMGAVATANAGTQYSGPDSDIHHKLGLSVFILVLLQALLGALAHFTRGRASDKHGTNGTGKHWSRKLHMVLGIATLGLLYWTVWEGMHIEWPSMSSTLTETPQSVQILFWIIFLVPVLAYLIGAGTSVLCQLQPCSGHYHQAPLLQGNAKV